MNFTEQLETATSLSGVSPEKSIEIFQSILNSEQLSEEDSRVKEQAILRLAELYQQLQKAPEICELVRSTKPFLLTVSKAKTTKIVRTLIDLLSNIEGAKELQIELCQECIQWSTDEKRIYLKQSLETRLIALYLQNKQYGDALRLIGSLLTELKRLDDKMLLVEVQLLESKVCLELRNLPKSKAALTSARTSANAMYCPPLLQASLDIQSGILHAEEKDFKTAYSYFYEAFEGFSSQDDNTAILALKYMLLCKIMLHNADDVSSILNSKTALRYVNTTPTSKKNTINLYTSLDIDAMRDVAKAAQHRSLKLFEKATKDHPHALEDDLIIKSHLSDLYDTLLEGNLSKIVEPFSVVEINHIATLIDLPIKTVETKISQMILDKKFYGVLDQGAGCLVVFDDPTEDKMYESSLKTIANMSKVTDSLFQRAAKLS